MNYLLDTNAASGVLRGKQPQIKEKLARTIEAGYVVGIPVIVVFELWFGVARSGHVVEQSERVRLFLSEFKELVPVTVEDAEIAGKLRGELMARGNMIGPYDLLIAAQTLRLGATLVTANIREFARVPDLKWEDWSQPLTNP
jgi:tRNA(fMet)-specific endonuclease VapC